MIFVVWRWIQCKVKNVHRYLNLITIYVINFWLTFVTSVSMLSILFWRLLFGESICKPTKSKEYNNFHFSAPLISFEQKYGIKPEFLSAERERTNILYKAIMF